MNGGATPPSAAHGTHGPYPVNVKLRFELCLRRFTQALPLAFCRLGIHNYLREG